MSQLTIYKASAGSGKTFRLVMEYLKLLLVNPFNYKHILAVTFTNKATTEMKERILRDLYKVATHSDENILELLEKETGLPQLKLEENAKLALANILHDYDRFSVSTIDSFFQRVLRSFARESGLYGTYEVELDQDAILEEACDRLLQSVEDDVELRNWLLTMSEDQLGEGKNWSINDKILELGKELYKESFQEYLVHQDSVEVERDKLKILRAELTKTRKWFEKECRELGQKALALIASQGLSVMDFKYKAASFANAFNKLANYKGGTIELGKRFQDALDNVDTWASSKDVQGQMASLYGAGLNDLMHQIIGFIDKGFSDYVTASELQKYVSALGVLTTMSGKIREIGQENNSLLLSEGNLLLKGIIGNNDAPFVYEKAGTYYRYFMIDEFQDTSVTQWENMKPLVSNSLAENNPNLVVGDVKQSIYRWRNSDWQLLNKHLKQELGKFKIDETNLDANWRSSENVVEFNNQFFKRAKDLLQNNFNNEMNGFSHPDTNEFLTTIQNAYADVEQLPASKEKGGYIKCEFIEKTDYDIDTLGKVVEAVKEAQDKGYHAGDIAILVKKNKQGKEIAEALLAEKKRSAGYIFEVISDDSLYIDSSATVRFLVDVMRYILAPHDKVIQASAVYEFATYILPVLDSLGKLPVREVRGTQQLFNFEVEKQVYRIISKQVQIDYFPFFNVEEKTVAQKWSYRSLVDLTDELIQRYNLDCLSGEQANLQAFKDVVSDFSKRESGNLHKFIEWWNQFGNKVKLQSAGERDAIRIMTIHKSKGLEFPIVIIPFCDWSFAPEATKSNIMWCSTVDSKFNQFPILPVKYTKSLQKSHFAKDYYTEMLLSYIDNLNVLYVAQTRAVKALYLFTEKLEKEQSSLSVSGLLKAVLGQITDNVVENSDSCFSIGILSALEKQREKKSSEVDLSGKVRQHKNIGESLRLRRNYIDFLDDSESAIAAQINQGKLLHEVLSLIETKDDLHEAIRRVSLEGKIENDETLQIESELKILLSNEMVEMWFDGTGRVLNETTIIAPGFDVSRPDRVMLFGDKVIIVDYKSTAIVSKSHQNQVMRYMKSIEQMGYNNIEGYVWYLKSNQILNVETDF